MWTKATIETYLSNFDLINSSFNFFIIFIWTCFFLVMGLRDRKYFPQADTHENVETVCFYHSHVLQKLLLELKTVKDQPLNIKQV